MSQPLLDLRSPDNWVATYAIALTAPPAPNVPGGWFAMSDHQVPVLISSPILMVQTSSAEAESHWRKAGDLSMLIDGPGINGGDVLAGRRMVPINQTTLIQFPALLPQYRLKFLPVPWIRQMNLTIWEYTGSISDTTRELIQNCTDLVRADLSRLETKVDRL